MFWSALCWLVFFVDAIRLNSCRLIQSLLVFCVWVFVRHVFTFIAQPISSSGVSHGLNCKAQSDDNNYQLTYIFKCF